MLPLLLVAIGSLAAVGAMNAFLVERQTCEQIERQLRGVIGVSSASNFPLTDGVLRQMRDLSSAEFVLTDLSGVKIASSLPQAEPLPIAPTVAQIKDVGLGAAAWVAGRWYFHTSVELPAGPGFANGRVLHVLFPQEQYRRTWRQAFVPSLIVGAVAIVGVAAVAHSLANRIGRTTARLAKEVVRLARGEFGTVDLPSTDDEIRDLSVAVNHTAQMLADYEQQVRRTEQMRTATMLGASLAHQMRNAATGCRMALDLHAEECCGKKDQESLQVAKRQLRLMESQLQRFLRIGKCPAELVQRDVDLVNLVENLLPLIRPAAHHAGVELAWDSSLDRLPVSADEEALSQAVLNLLLNAVEAAQQGGCEGRGRQRVCVHIGAVADEAAELVIGDSGPGPSEAVASSLFDPFVTSKAEGAGLGLAVSKQVVMAHGGSIGWHRANGMTRFRITLPLTQRG
jgi:signal transduction histidine kinase